MPQTLDSLVRERLKEWPQRPPGVKDSGPKPDVWLRGRPPGLLRAYPFLKLPGSTRWRTLPDGLRLNFGGTPVDPFVDIFAIEACSTLQNPLDKRSRFAPSTHSMLSVCPLPWLMAPVTDSDPTPRWKVIGMLRHEPTVPFVAPVRHMRVLYGLKQEHYRGFVRHQLPHGHEFFVPVDALTACDSDKNPDL